MSNLKIYFLIILISTLMAAISGCLTYVYIIEYMQEGRLFICNERVIHSYNMVEVQCVGIKQ